MDEPLEYTGTGKELALGFLIVAGAVLAPIAALQLTGQLLFAASPYRFVIDIAAFTVVLFLVGVGVYRARRYRLSRTLWRGIRGTLTGSSWAYGVRNFAMTLLLPFTLFWSYPWMSISLTSRMTREMEFGNRPFLFTGGSRPLYGSFALMWIGTALAVVAFLAITAAIGALAGLVDGTGGLGAVTETATTTPDTSDVIVALTPLFLLIAVGVVFVVLRSLYAAGELNYIAKSTGYEGLEFKMNATAGSLLGLFVVNLFIRIATLGIATAFVQQRLMRYVCDRLTVHGTLDVAAIRQSQADPGHTGEGIAEMFDIDAF